MDYLKGLVKEETEYSDTDILVEDEVSNKDWCINYKDIEVSNQFSDEEVVYDKMMNNLHRCFRCDEQCIDSRSLLKHNLTHLYVSLEKLPDEIFGFYKLPENPSKVTIKNELSSDVEHNMDMPETTCDRKPDNILIKCEIVECNSETTDSFPVGDNSKDNKQLTLENNNNIGAPKSKISHRCHICSKDYNYKNWHAHMNEVHSTKTFQCDLCKKEYKSKKGVRNHSCIRKIRNKPAYKMKKSEKKNPVGTFKCCHCNNVFHSKDCMNKHVKNVHSKAVQCEICNSRLRSEVYLAAHMRRVHYDDGKVHSCDVCGKIFKSPRYVRVHMKNTHYNKKSKSYLKT